MKDYPLLKNAPHHDTPEFLDYLRANNPVIHDGISWLIIENCKYHTPENPWYTAFWKGDVLHIVNFDFFFLEYPDWEWLKKAKINQTVKRFHIHLIKK